MTDPVLVSIQVSLPRSFGREGATDPMHRPWTTGLFKEPVSGPVRLGITNLEGDGQADLVHHGGPDKAVLAYSAEHYPDWRQTMNNPSLAYGAFGENFTVNGLTEADVCVGDAWQVGDEVVVQVSQPRQPCWKLARRWQIKSLALDVQQSGRTGWYFRVLQEGMVAAGMTFVLRERPYPGWTVQRASQVMHAEQPDFDAVMKLAANPLLSNNWRARLTRMANKQKSDPKKRLIGENE